MGHIQERVQEKTDYTNQLQKSVLAALSLISTLNITQKLNLDSEFQTRTIPNIIAPCPGVFTPEEAGVTNEL